MRKHLLRACLLLLVGLPLFLVISCERPSAGSGAAIATPADAAPQAPAPREPEAPARPQAVREEAGKVLKDYWNSIYLDQEGGSVHCGSGHVVIREIDREGRKLYQTSLEMNLTIKRDGTLLKQRVRTGNLETADGKVLSVFYTQFLDKGKEMTLIGEVKDGKFQLRRRGQAAGAPPALERRGRWSLCQGPAVQGTPGQTK